MTDKKRISQGTLHCTNAEQPLHANTPPKDAMAKDTLYLLMFSLNARPRTVCADSKLANTAGIGNVESVRAQTANVRRKRSPKVR